MADPGFPTEEAPASSGHQPMICPFFSKTKELDDNERELDGWGWPPPRNSHISAKIIHKPTWECDDAHCNNKCKHNKIKQNNSDDVICMCHL